GVDLTVVGVMSCGFQGLTGSAEIWVPAAMVPRLSYADYHSTNQDFISVIGRRAPGVSLERARAELAALGVRIERVLPSDTDVPTVFGATAVPVSKARIDPAYRKAIFVLLTAVLLLLLLTCANVAGLELARNVGRAREIAVRLAIGAHRAGRRRRGRDHRNVGAAPRHRAGRDGKFAQPLRPVGRIRGSARHRDRACVRRAHGLRSHHAVRAAAGTGGISRRSL